VDRIISGLSLLLLKLRAGTKTKGSEMVELLLREIEQHGSASPTLSEAPSVFSDVSAPSTNTSYPSEEVETSV
jgi:hypothetical protein